MRRVLGLFCLLVLALPAACTREAPQIGGQPRYLVGNGYQRDGTWFYPREDFRYSATGLATILPDRAGTTANGERYDPSVPSAAHQTLQLPAVARVTNLETGAQLLLRINDRGPAAPGRLVALSPRAAALLGIGGTGRVRVEVDEGLSTALRDQLGGGPKLLVAAAPRAGVRSESLAPPPGIAQSTRGRAAPAASAVEAEAAPDDAVRVPDRLPDTVTRVPASPGLLVLRAGSFAQAQYAQRVAAKIPAGRVERVPEGRASRFDVVAGPFPTVPEADGALDRARRAGVSDARIAID